MSNKYIYLSSEGTNNHSDFQVQFPENLIIKPHSQLRVLNVRVNPDDNTVEISEGENNVFYVGVDYWVKQNSCMPLIPVVLDSGIYYLDDASAADNAEAMYLVNHLQEKINLAFFDYCLFRDGFTCELNGSDKLTIKCSPMELYGCPTLPVSVGDIEYWELTNVNKYDRLVNIRGFAEPVLLHGCELDDAEMNYDPDDVLYGAKILPKTGNKHYFLSATLVTGLTGKTDSDPFVHHYYEFDLRNVELGEDEYLQVWDGYFDSTTIGTKASNNVYSWGYDRFHDGQGNLGFNNHYCFEITKDKVIFAYRNVLDAKVIEKTLVQNNFNTQAIFRIERNDYENNKQSFMGMTIEYSTDDGANWDDVFGQDESDALETIVKNLYAIHSVVNNNTVGNSVSLKNRLGFIMNTDQSLTDVIQFSASVDIDGVGFNIDATVPGFKDRAPLNTDLPSAVTRPLSVVTDNVSNSGETDELNDTIMNVAKANVQDDPNDLFANPYTYPSLFQPNCKFLNLSVFGIAVTAYSSGDSKYPIYTTGIVGKGAVRTNDRSFPQFYLDLPSLPIENITAGPKQGYKNSFACPIKLAEGENKNLFTSELYTPNYSTLTNTHPINLNNMKVRICDIKGVPAKHMLGYTIVVLEIRDNPDIKHQEMIQAMSELSDNYNRMLTINNQGQ